MFNRKKTEAKRFVQIFKPLISNSLNFKSQILSSVELAFGTDIERGEKTHTFRVTFFFEDGENSSFDNYCWQSEDRLLEAKDLIKRAFSVKTFEEFKTLYIKHNNRL